jgi:hypothetical protein
MTPLQVSIIAALALLGGCTTEAQRKVAENMAIQKQAAQEVRRICALPQAQREAELRRLRAESAIVVECSGD